MTDKSYEINNTGGLPYEVGSFRQEDADGIVRLFKAVYGEGYPIRLFYDPKGIIDANRSGELYAVVARTPSGEVIGVHHLYRSAPFRDLYEWGAGVVLEQYRGEGVSGNVAKLMDAVIIPELQLLAVFGEAVCNHLHMQKACIRLGYLETAIEVALMPAEAYTHAKTSSSRVATVLSFKCYRQKPHTVYLPRVYEHELRFIYEGIQDVRTFARSDQDLNPHVESSAEMTIFDFAKVARIAVHQTAADFSSLLDDLETRATDQGTLVLQVWVKLSDPAVAAAVEVLRRRGYFIGGPLPRWFDADGLLMQKLFCPPDFEKIQLYTDRARAILDMIKSDYERALGERPDR